MSELLLYGLVAMGAGVLLLQLVLLQRSGRKDDSLEPGFSALQSGLERVERELRQEMARARQESATAARGDREEQAQSLDRLAESMKAAELFPDRVVLSTSKRTHGDSSIPICLPFSYSRASLPDEREPT